MSLSLGMGAALPADSTLRDDVQQKLRVDELKRTLDGGRTKEKKLREACEGFESVFLSKMFSEMRSTIPKDGLLHGQYEEQYYSMFDKALCDKMADAGGVGLADMMYRQLRGRVLGKGEGKAVPGDVLPANRTLASHPASDTIPVPGQGLAPTLRSVPYQMLLPGSGLAASHTRDPEAGQAAAAAQAAKDMSAPVTGRITSEYGWRTDPFKGDKAWHAGMDIAAAEGDPVDACWAGTVVFAGVKGGYGNVVEVEHPGGWTSVYGHLRRYTVREGDQVAAGGKIAEVGSTGRSTGPHLHFELRRGQETVDPEAVLAQAGLIQEPR
jgi:peptidoglycan hydrolase FlgJ